MLAVVISSSGDVPRRKTFAATSVMVGSSPTSQLQLGGIDERHARLAVRGDAIVVEDYSQSGTRVNQRRITGPHVLEPGDQVMVGAYVLAAELVVVPSWSTLVVEPRGPVEHRLLDAIAGGDHASRLIYADWLEQHGDGERAAFLRTQHELSQLAPGAPGFEDASDRLRQLAAHVDPGWRARVATRTIEACAEFDFACPQQWANLTPTGNEAVRHCGACKRNVFYCGSVEDAREHAAAGNCVALDITAPRWGDNDIAAPYGTQCVHCERDIGSRLVCPCCGASQRAMMRGKMVAR